MLSMRQKEALTATIIRRYQKAGKKEKTQMLDEFVKNTGYNRSYARRKINKSKTKDFRKTRQKRKVARKKEYGVEVVKALTKIWVIQNHICGKRLKPFLPELVRILGRDKSIEISKDVKQKLIKISAATIDRSLKPLRKKLELKGRSGTKPGTLLKSSIPIRTFADWDDDRPGFFELDSVAFCGGTLSGHHVWGLDFVDVSTGWVGLDAVMGKGQYGVHEASKRFRSRLVFKMLGIDSDNGSEFINGIMKRFCDTNEITFTRIRPGKKNDNCYVEQKNYTTLRNFLGYSRYDTEKELEIIRELLKLVEIYVNFFQPSLKLIHKKRTGARVYKKYDEAKTPYQRLLRFGILGKKQKSKLHEIYDSQNPMKLIKEIRKLQSKLSKLNRYKLDEATNE